MTHAAIASNEGLPRITEPDKFWNGIYGVVEDTVAALDWNGKDAVFVWDGQAFPAKMLMLLLAYCYATGSDHSSDIADRTREDHVARYICSEAHPSANLLRRFRRQYKLMLRRCLEQIMEFALKIRFGSDKLADSIPDYCAAIALDRWIEPLCVPWPAEEADERLGRACFIDGMLAE